MYGWLPALMVLAATLFLGTGCESDTGDTGLEVLPDDDRIGLVVTDTISIEMETRIVDSVLTGNAESQMLGNYIDPQFGRLRSTFFTQVTPKVDLTFGNPNRLRFDSLVLSIAVISHYGQLETPQRVQVYEVQEDFPEADQLFSNQPLRVDPRDLCHPDDPNGCIVRYPRDAASALDTITVRLSDELGRRLLFASESSLGDIDAFREFFKGLAVTTAPVPYLSREPGAIFNISGNSSITSLTLHYGLLSVNNIDYEEQAEVFLITENDGGKMYHTIERTEVDTKLLGTSIREESDVYQFVQAGGLVELFGKFPSLSGLPTLGVNKAELIIRLDDSFFGAELEDNAQRFPPIGRLRMLFVDENGIPQQPAIQELGTLRPEYDADGRSYSFRMTPYVQRLMRNKQGNFGFVIRPFIFNDNVRRIVVGGPDHPTRKPILNLIYTQPKE